MAGALTALEPIRKVDTGVAGVFTGPIHRLLALGNASDEAMYILRLSVHFKGNIQFPGMKYRLLTEK